MANLGYILYNCSIRGLTSFPEANAKQIHCFFPCSLFGYIEVLMLPLIIEQQQPHHTALCAVGFMNTFLSQNTV